MSVITSGKTFANGEQLSADKLNLMLTGATFDNSAVDLTSTFVDSNGAIVVRDSGITTPKIADDAVTTSKIADSNVTKAKIEDLADYKVLGNVSGGAASPAEVAILDEDDMASDSATSLATQQSIKAYVDGKGEFTPSTYAGGESVTLPNGLIMKFGSITSGIPTYGVLGTITLASAFPNACLYANIITDAYNAGSQANNVIESVSTTQIQYKHGTLSPTVIYWQAIGY